MVSTQMVLGTLEHALSNPGSLEKTLLRIRTDLIQLSQEELRELFERSQAHISVADLSHIDSLPLWLFSHPSCEVFRSLLLEIETYALFARYISCVAEAAREKKRPSRRKIKKLANGIIGPLAVRYTNLILHCHLVTHWKKSDGWWNIGLGGEEITEQLVQHQMKELRENKLRSELNRRLHSNIELVKRMSEAPLSFSYQLLGIFKAEASCQGSSIDVESLHPIAEDFFLQEEYFGLSPYVGEKWKPIGLGGGMMVPSLSRGKWPKFSLVGKPAVKVRIKEARYTPHKELMDAVVENAMSLRERSSETLRVRLAKTECGLLPVGTKLHCLGSNFPALDFLPSGAFSAHGAARCFNLPPVGNTSALAEMLSVIEKRAGIQIFNNSNVQIQICSPGVLTPRHAALLGICFYMGSEKLRRYNLDELRTSHSTTGRRLVVYGANVVNRNFNWWVRSDGGLIVEKLPQTFNNRTDVLTCTSIRDIENINLVATLLAHLQYGGYWADLGKRFVDEITTTLSAYELEDTLEAPWVKRDEATEDEDERFFAALQKLTDYAFSEAHQVSEALERKDLARARNSLMYRVQDLLATYRAEIEFQASLVEI